MGAEADSCLNRILKKEGEPTAAAAPPSTRSTTTMATTTRPGATPIKRKKVRVALTDTCWLIVIPPGLPDDGLMTLTYPGDKEESCSTLTHLTSLVGWGYSLETSS